MTKLDFQVWPLITVLIRVPAASCWVRMVCWNQHIKTLDWQTTSFLICWPPRKWKHCTGNTNSNKFVTLLNHTHCISLLQGHNNDSRYFQSKLISHNHIPTHINCWINPPSFSGTTSTVGMWRAFVCCSFHCQRATTAPDRGLNK